MLKLLIKTRIALVKCYETWISKISRQKGSSEGGFPFLPDSMWFGFPVLYIIYAFKSSSTNKTNEI